MYIRSHTQVHKVTHTTPITNYKRFFDTKPNLMLTQPVTHPSDRLSKQHFNQHICMIMLHTIYQTIVDSSMTQSQFFTNCLDGVFRGRKKTVISAFSTHHLNSDIMWTNISGADNVKSFCVFFFTR